MLEDRRAREAKERLHAAPGAGPLGGVKPAAQAFGLGQGGTQALEAGEILGFVEALGPGRAALPQRAVGLDAVHVAADTANAVGRPLFQEAKQAEQDAVLQGFRRLGEAFGVGRERPRRAGPAGSSPSAARRAMVR